MNDFNSTVEDSLIARLRRYITQHQLLPGGRLPAERQLAAELGVSRSSLREALKPLISAGVIGSRPGGGTWLCQPLSRWSEQQLVTPLRELMQDDPDYCYDILEARQAIEAGTAWYAARRATDADRERLSLAFDATLKLQQEDDADLAAQADVRFHLCIAEASHNLVLLQTMRGLFALLHASVRQSRQRIFSQPAVFSQLAEQHQRLHDAILAGEADAARLAAIEHLKFVHTTLKALDEEESRLARSLRLPGDNIF